MRDIKFRGFSKADGWIFGCYATDCADYHAILMNNEEDELYMLNKPVDKRSIGQCTGIEDSKATELCQGDICRVDGLGNCEVGICKFYGTVFKKDGCEYPAIDSIAEGDTFEVIGNMYENPELLETNND